MCCCWSLSKWIVGRRLQQRLHCNNCYAAVLHLPLCLMRTGSHVHVITLPPFDRPIHLCLNMRSADTLLTMNPEQSTHSFVAMPLLFGLRLRGDGWVQWCLRVVAWYTSASGFPHYRRSLPHWTVCIALWAV
jgi:hypothetical protein